MTPPYIIVIAGPNGVGKSTFAKWYLLTYPDCEGIVDPDAIARGLDIPSESERAIRAGRFALECIDRNIKEGKSFAIETTLSGKTLSRTLKQAKRSGYYVAIVLLQVVSRDVTSTRIEQRVKEGGHNIPEVDQVRRFDRCYTNFYEIYQGTCHEWTIYDARSQRARKIQSGRGGFSDE